MGFKKGHPKVGGRVKGLPSKKTMVLNNFAELICEGGMDRFQTAIQSLDDKDYVDAFLRVFEYVRPKLQRTDQQSNINQFVYNVELTHEEMKAYKKSLEDDY